MRFFFDGKSRHSKKVLKDGMDYGISISFKFLQSLYQLDIQKRCQMLERYIFWYSFTL